MGDHIFAVEALHCDNVDTFVSDLKAKSHRKLLKEEKIQARFESVGRPQKDGHRNSTKDVARSNDEILATLEKHVGEEETFIYLFQDHTWQPFNISEDGLKTILAAARVRRDFTERLILRFGYPGGGYETNHSGGYDCDMWLSDTGSIGFHLAYSLDYVAKTGRPDHPWSERRMGVYHKVEVTKTTLIILQPTTAALTLAKRRSASKSNGPDGSLHLHIFLHASILPAWNDYLAHLESLVQSKSRACRLAGKNVHGADIALSIVQDLQYYSELLHNAMAHLRSSLEILHGLQSLLSSGLTGKGETVTERHYMLLGVISQFKTNLKWTDGMLDRTKQISNIVTMLVQQRHSEALGVNTALMTNLAQSSKGGQDIMLELSRVATRDSGAMKAMAMVTMVSLPSILLTGIFSTGFVGASVNGSTDEKASNGAVIKQAMLYGILTVMTTMMAGFGAYRWFQRQQRP